MVGGSQLTERLDGEAAKLPTAGAIAALESAEIGVSPLLPLMALMARREEVTPRLLSEAGLTQHDLEQREAAKPDERRENFLHVFSLYLLAWFAEPRAFAPLVRLLAEDSEKAARLLGEVVTEDLHAILARTYDGSGLAEIKSLIEDDSAEAYVRDACLKSLRGMALLGKIDRGEVVAYFDRLLDQLRTDRNVDWADCFVMSVAELQEPALRPKIERWFEDDLVSTHLLPRQEIDDVYAQSPEELAMEVLRADHFESLEAYLSGWAWFTSNDPAEFAALDDDDFDDEDWAESSGPPPNMPLVRATPKVGRNDPCPCGSGKKYKKCCLI